MEIGGREEIAERGQHRWALKVAGSVVGERQGTLGHIDALPVGDHDLGVGARAVVFHGYASGSSSMVKRNDVTDPSLCFSAWSNS